MHTWAIRAASRANAETNCGADVVGSKVESSARYFTVSFVALISTPVRKPVWRQLNSHDTSFKFLEVDNNALAIGEASMRSSRADIHLPMITPKFRYNESAAAESSSWSA